MPRQTLGLGEVSPLWKPLLVVAAFRINTLLKLKN